LRKDKGKKNTKQRWIITIITAALAAVISYVLFIMMRSRVPNMHIIFYLVLGFLILLVGYLILWALGSGERTARLATVLKRCYFVGLSLGLALFITLQGLIISSAHTEVTEVDCLIVLGAGLRNGSPSLVLRSRLNAALEYYNTQGDIPIIVSGGLGNGETITEAEAMFRYLKARGVDESLIWKEEAATRTQEHFVYSLAIMEEKGLDIENIRVGVVSNEFHLYRAKLLAEKSGLDAIGVAAKTPRNYLRVLYHFREAFAIVNEVVFSR